MNHTRLTDEQLRLFALDDELFDAEVIAAAVKSKRYPSRLLDILAVHDPRTFQLVADVLKGKRTRSHLNADQIKIMRAYDAAEWACGRRSFDGTHRVLDLSKPPPTLFVIRMQYALGEGLQSPTDPEQHRNWLKKLEKRNKIPRYVTFQRTLKRCHAEFTLENPHAD